MKTKVVFLLMAGCLLALAAWLVQVPSSTQADEIPEKYRDTVRKGLEYLVKNQHKDGHWEGDDGKHPVAMTGLVGLALLMERDGPGAEFGGAGGKAKYSAEIRKAAHWLMDKSPAGRDGLLFSEHPSETARYMEGHGLATLFLAGAGKYEHDEALRKKHAEVLTRAVKYIVKAQSTQGGWYHTSKVEGHDFDDISATAIQLQALQAADNAGIPHAREAMSDAKEYLKKALGRQEGSKPGQSRSRAVETAAALAGCFRMSTAVFNGKRSGADSEDEWSKKWVKYCKAEIPVGRDIKFGRDELANYYYAQAMFNLGGDTWTTYRTAMFDHLKSSQDKNGSWPASDGISVGQVYATALWCTILQLDNGNHPSIPSVRSIMVTWNHGRGVDPWPGLRLATASDGKPVISRIRA